MSLHQIMAGLLNDYSYTTIVQVLNEMTKEMFDHHSRNYNDMVTSHLQDFFTTTVPATPSHEVDLSEEIAKQMSVDATMLGNLSSEKEEPKPKALKIKMTKPKRAAPVEESVPTVSVTKTEEPLPETKETVVVAPKKLKKPVAKAKRV